MSRKLEQGIQAVQDGNLDEGARLIRIALKDENLAPDLRAVGLLGLAQTNADIKFKIECYRRASQIDPKNETARQLLNDAMTSQLLGKTGSLSSNSGSQQVPTTDTGTLNPNTLSIQNPIESGYTSRAMTPISPELGTGPLDPTTLLRGQTPLDNTTGGMRPISANDGTGPLFPQHGAASSNSNIIQGPLYLQNVQRTVGILDGPNGVGTGIFVTREGLIATTRFVVGGEQQVQVELQDKRIMLGSVVRSFPEFDLAFIQVNLKLAHLLSVNQAPILPDNLPIIAVTHSGQGLRSTKRATRHQTETHWFPTMINRVQDAGGNPIFTGQDNLLVGILTKDASRTNGFMYGLHIRKIYQCVEQYYNEANQYNGQKTAYCPACGIISRAPNFGGNYCEHCGNTLPYALDITRYPQPQITFLYGESNRQPCPNCGAQAGFHRNTCLRCGYEL